MSESQRKAQQSKELQDYLQDLYNWENEIKKKDAELRRRYLEQAEQQLIRVQKKTAQSLKKVPDKDKKSSKVPQNKNKKGDDPSNSHKTPKGLDYSSWDKFDVGKALKGVGLEESDNTTENSEDEEMEIEQKKQRAILEKDKGNNFFKQGKYDDAIACYTTGINLDPTNAMLPANRALALLRKNQFAAAEKDCTAAIAWDPSYVKAYHRRGIVRVKMKLYEQAREDFVKALKLDPNNKESKQELDNLGKILYKQQKKTALTNSISTGEKNKENSVRQKDLKAVNNAAKVKKSESLSDKLSEMPEKLADQDNVPFKDWDKWKIGSFTKASNIVVPVVKPLHLRSKKPLRRIEVQEVDSSVNQGIPTRSLNFFSSSSSSSSVPVATHGNTSARNTSVANEGKVKLSSVSSTQSAPLLSHSVETKQSSIAPKVPGIPQTSYQFMVDWRTLCHFPEKQCDYLMQIPAEEISRIFYQCMETEIFSAILEMISKYFFLKQCDPYPYLLAVTKVGRFSTLCMFMSTADKENLKSVVEELKQRGNYTEEQLQELSRKFCLEF